MQSDKMCPVTLGNHKTKTPIGRHPWQPPRLRARGAVEKPMRTLEQQQDPWQPPTPAGFEQGVPWRSPCEHSNSSRIRAHATQNAVRQNAFRYLRNPYKTKTSLLAGTLGRLQHQQASKECHGGAHAKHSNSSRLRAHAQQNAVQQNAPRYLWNPLESI